MCAALAAAVFAVIATVAGLRATHPRWGRVQLASSLNYAPTRRMATGADPPAVLPTFVPSRWPPPARSPRAFAAVLSRIAPGKRPGPTPSAAAGSPRARREPLSPGTDGDHPACGLTSACRPLPTG